MNDGVQLAIDTVPVPLTSFVGRDAELRTVVDLVRTHRLVTLTGSGGCGKTRLAQHVARSLSIGEFSARWWVELAPVADAAQVADEVARAVGLMSAPGTDVVPALVRRLADDGRGLLVVDNAEHVADATARVVVALLAGCETARILVTSREPLAVPGEVIWRVPSLSVPPSTVSSGALADFGAARLLLERAREQRPGLVVDDEACGAIAAICARLDGMPLALELAAARLRTMPLTRVVRGLDDAFGLLTGGARTALPRQQTLRVSIAWSVDLLGESDRVVLRRLAVFQGPFTLEAAEAVTADEVVVASEGVVDAVGRLVDRSLVQFDDRTDRYRLLETVRQFGIERLAATGELTGTRVRHAAWWAQFCVEAGDGRLGFTAGSLAWAMPDIAAAEEWSRSDDPTYMFQIARGLGWLRTGLGYWAHLARSCDTVVGVAPVRRDEIWAGAVSGLGFASVLLQRDDVVQLLPSATLLLGDDPGARRLARFAPALVEAFDGRVVDLRALAADVIAANDEPAFPYVVGAMLSVGGALGDLDEAHAMRDALATVLRRRGLPYTCDTALVGHYGTIYLLIEQGRLDEAVALVAAADEPADAAMFVATAAATATLGCVLDDVGLLQQVQRWMQRDIAPGSRSTASYVLAITAFAQGRTAEAADHIRDCLHTDSFVRAMYYLNYRRFVIVLLAAGHRDEARQLIDTAVAHVRTVDHAPLPSASLHFCAALLAYHELRDGEALEESHAALAQCTRHGFTLLRLDTLELLAAVIARRGQTAAAARVIGSVAAARHRIGYRQLVTPDPEEFRRVAAQLRQHEPVAHAAGTSTTIDDIVAYVQRTRGQRSRPMLGWESLTPTERQVADLVATGAANAQVATTLLMSPATVKTHLTRVFAKLGVSNRTELAIRRPPGSVP